MSLQVEEPKEELLI